ncbi:MAG: S41 family peptidase [Acidobacteriota bacterium]
MSAAVVTYGLVGGILKRVPARDDPYGQLSIFTDVLNKVETEYVEVPDIARAMDGALHGMMEALDPYSSFVGSATYQELAPAHSMAASPGLVLSKRYGYIQVVTTLPESPAEKAGLRKGDLIESINNLATTGMSLWEAQARLRGPAQSSVKLRVVRARRSQPTEVTLVRSEMTRPEVSAGLPEPTIGLLRIPAFEGGVADQVAAKLKLLKSSSIRGLLVDIRGNAQGSIDEAAKAADLFLAKGGRILSLKDRAGTSLELASLSEPLLVDVPIVLLVDGGTSRAAEAFGSALRDNGVASVVGEKTNGCGSVQKRFTLTDGSVVFISTQLIFRPSGKPLQAASLRESGIDPDTRSPSREFVTSFYFANTPDHPSDDLGDDFYRKLDKAIDEEQLKSGLELIREKVSRKAA